MPTLKQLLARHPDAVMKWFARGRLWESQEEENADTLAKRRPPAGEHRPPSGERRTRDWRPGGEHKDPRDRFKVSRDEKRKRFADNLRREHPKPPADDTKGGPPPDAPPAPDDASRPDERAKSDRPQFDRPRNSPPVDRALVARLGSATAYATVIAVHGRSGGHPAPVPIDRPVNETGNLAGVLRDVLLAPAGGTRIAEARAADHSATGRLRGRSENRRDRAVHGGPTTRDHPAAVVALPAEDAPDPVAPAVDQAGQTADQDDPGDLEGRAAEEDPAEDRAGPQAADPGVQAAAESCRTSDPHGGPGRPRRQWIRTAARRQWTRTAVTGGAGSGGPGRRWLWTSARRSGPLQPATTGGRKRRTRGRRQEGRRRAGEMIAHVILFSPRADLSPAARRELLDALVAASAGIPSIRQFRVGRRIKHGLPGYEQMMRDDYEFAAIVEFDDVEALKSYPGASLTRDDRGAFHGLRVTSARIRLCTRGCRRRRGSGRVGPGLAAPAYRR